MDRQELTQIYDFAGQTFVVTGGTDCHGARLPDGTRAIDHPEAPDGVGEQFLLRCRALLPSQP